MPLPLKYNFRNITVRKSSTLATAFTIGLDGRRLSDGDGAGARD